MAVGSNFVTNLLVKLTGYLGTKEGHRLVGAETNNDGSRFITEDVFGFRYEIQVKMVGRNSSADSNNGSLFEEVV